MRLINTETLTFEEYANEEQLSYAILSHRWEDEEVSYDEFLRPRGQRRKGFEKIRRFCKKARRDGYDLAWVDTCCIDKRSSAELSEAINSMFRWYRNAEVCYAYLSDVRSVRGGGSMGRSLWFTRGWTLQELLAPVEVDFYDQSWTFIGSKEDLASDLSHITGIPETALRDGNLSEYRVAEKMKWASRRRTTRIEDGAYCLMGLFDINMPMLYGEGRKAFVRLQEEIMKTNDDQTIFAWTGVGNELSGLLADSPDKFDLFPDVLGPNPDLSALGVSPFAMTQQGVTLNLGLIPWSPGIYVAFLDNVRVKSISRIDQVGIFLLRLNKENFARISFLDRDVVYQDSLKTLEVCLTQVTVRQVFSLGVRRWAQNPPTIYGLNLSRCLKSQSENLKITRVVSHGAWDEFEHIMRGQHGHVGSVGLVFFTLRGEVNGVMEIGFDFNFDIWYIGTIAEPSVSKAHHETDLKDTESWTRLPSSLLTLEDSTCFTAPATYKGNWLTTDELVKESTGFKSDGWAIRGKRTRCSMQIHSPVDLAITISQDRSNEYLLILNMSVA